MLDFFFGRSVSSFPSPCFAVSSFPFINSVLPPSDGPFSPFPALGASPLAGSVWAVPSFSFAGLAAVPALAASSFSFPCPGASPLAGSSFSFAAFWGFPLAAPSFACFAGSSCSPGCLEGSALPCLAGAGFPPEKLPFTMSATSSSMELLAVFLKMFFSFKNSITSLDCIFNSFAISYILTFAIYCYLRYSVLSATSSFSIKLAANPSSSTARLARNPLPTAWPRVSFGAYRYIGTW